jgi:NAD-dependent SIR2 family protein deacetylase
MSYITLKCKECGNNFVWSQEEQELYQQRGLAQPEYCPICRGIIEARNRDTNRTRLEKGKK